MTGCDAVELLKHVSPRVAVPVHCDGWSHFAEPVDRLHADIEAHALSARVIRWITPGIPAEV
jgi:hypothetical protein